MEEVLVDGDGTRGGCKACGYDQFTVRYIALFERIAHNMIVIGQLGIPMLVYTCKRCGYNESVLPDNAVIH